MEYQFTDACIIGVEEIDNEHRELFRLVGKAHELLENESIVDKCEEIQAIMIKLKQYASTHFAHEEAYMESIGHPELEHQKRQHQFFVEKINELDIKGISENQEETLNEILTFLLRWLYRHIIGCDSMIGKLKPKGDIPEAKVESKSSQSYLCQEQVQMVSDLWHDTRYESVFTEKFLTGIPLIDEEHRELFRIINNIKNLIEEEFIPDKYDEIVHLLTELRNYAIYHFRDEEEYMEHIHYAGLEEQKKAHLIFIDHMVEIDLEDIDANQQKSLCELLDFLTEWLLNHIYRMDKKIK